MSDMSQRTFVCSRPSQDNGGLTGEDEGRFTLASSIFRICAFPFPSYSSYSVAFGPCCSKVSRRSHSDQMFDRFNSLPDNATVYDVFNDPLLASFLCQSERLLVNTMSKSVFHLIRRIQTQFWPHHLACRQWPPLRTIQS